VVGKSARARLLSTAALLGIATMAANLLGYVLAIVAARTLPTAAFGGFSALLALIIIGNVAALAVQAAVARREARGQPAPGATGLATAALVVTLGAALAFPLSRLLQLDSPGPMIAVALSLGALAAGAVPIGIAQGREQFGRLAALVLLQATLRVGGAAVALVGAPSLLAVMSGIAGGLTVTALIAWLWVRPSLGRRYPSAARETLSAATMLLGFVLVTNADVVLARTLLDPTASGVYAAGSIVTKVAFWLSQFVPLLAFPRLTSPLRRTRTLQAALGIVVVMGACVVTMSTLFAEPIVTLLAGERYLAVAPLLGWFALLGSLLAVANVAVYAGLARRDGWTTLLVWSALASLIGGALATQPNGARLVLLACGVALVLAVLSALREMTYQAA
jgi:O-antigen/teichoic acid export membrane protein